ncbi:MAG TPA: hypothetical protein VFQ76_21835 [Longimicrobiaceae bacterium]|nr:hypothetical protein [Longimicrobiaceae bacterium]
MNKKILAPAVIRTKLRRRMVALRHALGPFTEAVGVAAIGAICFVFASMFRIGGLTDWISYLASFVVAAILIYLMRRAARREEMLIEVTMSYLVTGGRPLFDQLLGRLIGGSWHGEELNPGDALFRIVEDICRGSEWELKRRVAEALPVLGEINEDRTLKLVRILRDDYDERWHSDIRRRTIEALVIPATSSSSPLIDRVDSKLLRDLLQLRERDQIYTAMAIVEALYEWEDAQPAITNRLRADLHQFSSAAFVAEENQALEELISLRRVAKNENSTILADRIEQMAKSENHFVRIVAARSLLLLRGRFPDRTLALMLACLGSDQHVNVRRAIARERSVSALAEMLRRAAHTSLAERVLYKLISDPDDLVRIPAFDKIDFVAEHDPNLALNMCDFIIAQDSSPLLVERARLVRAHLIASNPQ